MITVAPWAPQYADAFRRLNEAWINELFVMEAEDERVLGDPVGSVIEPGGEIFFVLDGDEVVGTAAMIPEASDVPSMELAKMAVDPAWKGRGLSRLLMQAALKFARARNLHQVTLVTNSALAPAVGLYRSFGFEKINDGDLHGWTRGDLAMRLKLQPDS